MKYKILTWYPRSKNDRGIIVGIYTENRFIKKSKEYIRSLYDRVYDVSDDAFEITEKWPNDILPDVLDDL